jgi:hypothetical protein
LTLSSKVRQNPEVSTYRMRKHQVVAICWSVLNLGLASLIPFKVPFPWVPVVVLALSPLLLMFFAEQIAGSLGRGVMARFASDRNEPQSPIVVMFAAWLILAIQTVVLLARLL